MQHFPPCHARALAFLALAPLASAQIAIEPASTPFVDIHGSSAWEMVQNGERSLTATELAAAGFVGNELLGLADIRIGINGAVIWNNSTGQVGGLNSTQLFTMPPSASQASGNGGTFPGAQFICPWWDDLFPTTFGAPRELDWTVVLGDLYIQWSDVDHYHLQGGDSIQFQMVVRGGVTIASRQPLVEFVYNDTLFNLPCYQNDGGSATIGFKNWGAVGNANDVQFGAGGGIAPFSDPTTGSVGRQPKVSGWSSGENVALPHALVIRGEAPASYCSPGLTSGGCTPVLSVSAQPSANASTPCILRAANVDGARSGLLFYGLSELMPVISWGPGAGTYLCVSSPVQRMSVQNSGGTAGFCDGALVEDLQAFQLAHPNALGSPWYVGQRIYVQGWFRDPFAPLGTSLTDSIKITMQ